MTLCLVQSVALMSLAAGGASDIYDTAANLTADLGVFLNGGTPPGGGTYQGVFPQFNPQLIGGDWTVVWGPVVVVEPPGATSYASNSMYVAYSASQSTYVVAIAGTDFDSIYDWFAEDADVAPSDMENWPLGTSGTTGPQISGATYNGVTNLQAMSDASGGTLQSYLSGVASTSDTLIFTGHSLGGALSPTLALAMYPDSTAQAVWSTVYVLPLAGPTPGNAQFADAFNTGFPQVSTGSTTYPYWNTNYANKYDMVPRAWSQLQSIQPPPPSPNSYYFSIWGKLSYSMLVKVNALIDDAKSLVAGGGYKIINTHRFVADWGYFDPGPTMPPPDGTWTYPPTWVNWPFYGITNPISSNATLEPLVVSAHLDQYYQFFGLLPFPNFPAAASTEAEQEYINRKRMAKSAAMLSRGHEPAGVTYRPAEDAAIDVD